MPRGNSAAEKTDSVGGLLRVAAAVDGIDTARVLPIRMWLTPHLTYKSCHEAALIELGDLLQRGAKALTAPEDSFESSFGVRFEPIVCAEPTQPPRAARP